MWLRVKCVVSDQRFLCNATDADVSGTYNVLPVFLFGFIWSEPIYYSVLYISRSLCVQEHTNVVSLCLFWPFEFCVSGHLFLCAFHVLLPFAFAQTVEGTHAVKSLILQWGKGFQASAVNLPPWVSLSAICLVERVTKRYMGRLSQEINLCYDPTPSPFLVRVGLLHTRFCASQIPAVVLNVALPPPLNPPVSLSV